MVTKNDAPLGRTGMDGEVTGEVPSGIEFHIAVTASGFAALGAWGAVASDEVWTFYLEPV